MGSKYGEPSPSSQVGRAIATIVPGFDDEALDRLSLNGSVYPTLYPRLNADPCIEVDKMIGRYPQQFCLSLLSRC